MLTIEIGGDVHAPIVARKSPTSRALGMTTRAKSGAQGRMRLFGNQWLMSALPLLASGKRTFRVGSFVPLADSATSFWQASFSQALCPPGEMFAPTPTEAGFQCSAE